MHWRRCDVRLDAQSAGRPDALQEPSSGQALDVLAGKGTTRQRESAGEMIVITADAASDDGREGAAGGGTRRGFQADGSKPEWERGCQWCQWCQSNSSRTGRCTSGVESSRARIS